MQKEGTEVWALGARGRCHPLSKLTNHFLGVLALFRALVENLLNKSMEAHLVVLILAHFQFRATPFIGVSDPRWSWNCEVHLFIVNLGCGAFPIIFPLESGRQTIGQIGKNWWRITCASSDHRKATFVLAVGRCLHHCLMTSFGAVVHSSTFWHLVGWILWIRIFLNFGLLTDAYAFARPFTSLGNRQLQIRVLGLRTLAIVTFAIFAIFALSLVIFSFSFVIFSFTFVILTFAFVILTFTFVILSPFLWLILARVAHFQEQQQKLGSSPLLAAAEE